MHSFIIFSSKSFDFCYPSGRKPSLHKGKCDWVLRVNTLRDTVYFQADTHVYIGCCYSLHHFLKSSFESSSVVHVFSCTLKLSLKVFCLFFNKKTRCVVKQIIVRSGKTSFEEQLSLFLSYSQETDSFGHRYYYAFFDSHYRHFSYFLGLKDEICN